MIDLDDHKIYSRVDPSEMRERIRELPEQCLKAWKQALSFKLSPDYSNIDKVIILGMGGSAISGDLLSSLSTYDNGILVLVNRDYDLPSYIDEKTLIIASSYSGMTEETLSSFNQALATPAKKLAITTGGRLKEIADQNGIPVFPVDYVSAPRAALAHSLFPLLAINQDIGLIKDQSNSVIEAIEVMKKLQDTIDENCSTNKNAAKQLAMMLYNHLVILYGAGFLVPVAQRWKTQLNENGKTWAFYEVFPELNHNAVIGYEYPKELAQKAFVVLLRSGHLHPRTLVRYDVTTELLGQANVGYKVINSMGESILSQMMSLVLFGDWVSYYLAILYETDPSPVKSIDYLKKRLAEA